MKKWALIVVAFAALVGSVLSVISTTEHMRIVRHGLEEASFCAISEKINCDIVNASSYSEFLGIPIAWWGVCYYVLIGGLSLLAYFSKKDKRASTVFAWGLSAGGLLYSAMLAYIASFILGVWCIECLGMYAANIVLFIFLFVALGIRVGDLFRFLRDYALAVFGRPSNLGFSPALPKHMAIAAVVFLVGWGAMASLQAKDNKGRDEVKLDEKVNAFYQQSLHKIEPGPDWAMWGNPDGSVEIIEFSEFQCPFCRMAAFNVKPYLQEFKKDVRFYFVNYPLDNACNDSMSGPMHQYACQAAKAGVCAQQKGDFWDYHDALFRNQRSLNEETILAQAEKMGWNKEEFLACINSPETDARVRADISAAKSIYVSGTPTIFINGRKVRYWRDPRFLQEIVKEEIKNKDKPSPQKQ